MLHSTSDTVASEQKYLQTQTHTHTHTSKSSTGSMCGIPSLYTTAIFRQMGKHNRSMQGEEEQAQHISIDL